MQFIHMHIRFCGQFLSLGLAIILQLAIANPKEWSWRRDAQAIRMESESFLTLSKDCIGRSKYVNYRT